MIQITAKAGGCVGLLVCSYWCEYSEYGLLLADWRTTGDPGDPGGLLAEKGCPGVASGRAWCLAESTGDLADPAGGLAD